MNLYTVGPEELGGLRKLVVVQLIDHFHLLGLGFLQRTLAPIRLVGFCKMRGPVSTQRKDNTMYTVAGTAFKGANSLWVEGGHIPPSRHLNIGIVNSVMLVPQSTAASQGIGVLQSVSFQVQ